MSAKFIDYDQSTLYLLPPSLQDWLPEDHLARFVVEIVDQLDLSSLKAAYAGRGSQPYNPEMLLALLFYGYATGVFSSRKLERSTYDSVAFRFIAANAHPDHDTIAIFRKRFLRELKDLFVQILLIAEQAGVLKLGTVSLDGTKVKANASKHKALSYNHACKLEEQLKAEVAELLRQAEAADQADLPDGMSIPEELSRRTERLKAIADAGGPTFIQAPGEALSAAMPEAAAALCSTARVLSVSEILRCLQDLAAIARACGEGAR